MSKQAKGKTTTEATTAAAGAKKVKMLGSEESNAAHDTPSNIVEANGLHGKVIATLPSPAISFNFRRTGPDRGAMTELAERCGVSQTMLSLVVNGKKLPPVMLLVKMAGVFTHEMRENGRIGKDEVISVDQILASPDIRKKIAAELKS